jgi:hypothetical protein
MIYEPREDSYLLEKVAAKYAKGKKVLDYLIWGQGRE